MVIQFFVNKQEIAKIQDKELITIGSSSDCDVCINDSSVKSSHCVIIYSKKKMFIRALAVDAPVLFNKSFVGVNSFVRLSNGVIKIGNVDVKISIKKNNKKKKAALVGLIIGVIILAGIGFFFRKNITDFIVGESREVTVEETETTIDEAEEITTRTTTSTRPSASTRATEEEAVVINLGNASIGSVDNQIYTGSPVICPVEIVSGGVTLREGVDYTCTYENNTGVGVATVTITGNDVTTTGSTSVTYAIVTGDAVCDSLENAPIVNFVERIYASALNRYPESEVLITCVNRLVNQTITGAELINVVYNSEEFSNRNLTDSDFLVSVYLGVLNREPDEGGFNSNITLLSNGMSRNNFINNIICSSEFGTICDSIGIISRGEQSSSTESTTTTAQGRYTEQDAYNTVRNHWSNIDWDTVFEYNGYLISDTVGDQYIVTFRSYTGVIFHYYFDINTGVGYETELGSPVNPFEEARTGVTLQIP